MNYLELHDVRKSFGEIHALRGVSFGIGAGEIVALLGPNGAGKTTSLEIALGLRAADGGSVRLFGGSPRDVGMRRRLGVTPQDSGFPDNLKVREIAQLVATHYPHPAAVDAALDAAGLSDLAARRVGTLSGGQQRRIAVALAFIGNPDLVVLDEPTTGVDVESRRRLWESIGRYAADGRSVLFTTHYLEEAEALAMRVVVIDRGVVKFDGTPSVLRERFGLRRLSYVGEPLAPVAAAPATIVQIDGRTVVTTSDTDAYVRALVTAGAPFAQLEVTVSSLEDAFLTMTGGSK
ncbi:MAG TPA: ABC transporter ATP-binding protein [Verrucomicrobiae bacterium]|nr:ABC transporter ATP-binding protein [Verrucomicrobiae bacterium]